jgi:hypothetical protein
VIQLDLVVESKKTTLSVKRRSLSYYLFEIDIYIAKFDEQFQAFTLRKFDSQCGIDSRDVNLILTCFEYF